jgi:hypothetical protein
LNDNSRNCTPLQRSSFPRFLVDVPDFRARYVDDLNSVDDLERYTPPPFMCLVEYSKENDPQNALISLLSICPTTGDVVWDEFSGM